jgi:urea transporter
MIFVVVVVVVVVVVQTVFRRRKKLPSAVLSLTLQFVYSSQFIQFLAYQYGLCLTFTSEKNRVFVP